MGKNKVSAEALRAHGYTYKLDVLTPAEAKERKVGRKVKNDKTNEVQTFESRDFDYFFKVVVPGSGKGKGKKPPVEARIYYAGKAFYYKGSKLKNINQLPRIEDDVKNTAHYEELQSLVLDTKARPYIAPTLPPSVSPGTVGYITLIGGPLDKQVHKYNNAFPFFMAQFEEGGKTLAARYVRDYNDPRLAEARKPLREQGLIVGDKNIYNFFNIIE